MRVDFSMAKLLPSGSSDGDMKLCDTDVLRETLRLLLDGPSGCLKWKELVSACSSVSIYWFTYVYTRVGR